MLRTSCIVSGSVGEVDQLQTLEVLKRELHVLVVRIVGGRVARKDVIGSSPFIRIQNHNRESHRHHVVCEVGHLHIGEPVGRVAASAVEEIHNSVGVVLREVIVEACVSLTDNMRQHRCEGEDEVLLARVDDAAWRIFLTRTMHEAPGIKGYVVCLDQLLLRLNVELYIVHLSGCDHKEEE